ncbi:hypothetical protein PRIO_3760 [Paenibacillus riograndensis SBR5]|uniref:Uncharacterized protein n=1 Tax=Paenibacillus riograndensis SBR5 TaxID=1073571 RepID=A0A0E3WHZ8_9BACL|nr:hypothetical protein PRIO_3760 [Paenibacillus riograndensis SBR5]
MPKYKSLILVLPQIGQVPLLREGVRHKALPRLFLDIFCSTFALDTLSYAQIEGSVKGDKGRMEVSNRWINESLEVETSSNR